MLHYPETRAISAIPQDASGFEAIDLDRVLSAIRRQLWLVAICAFVGALVGIAYVMSAVPLYTASTDVLIDKRQSRAVSTATDSIEVVTTDAEMASQVELLSSQHMARAVVTKLALHKNDAFLSGEPSLADGVRQAIGNAIRYASEFVAPSIVTEESMEAPLEDQLDAASGMLRGDLEVIRIPDTYVLTIRYTSSNPELAAKIANAYGDVYLDDQLQSKYDATRRASGWLQDRIAELKQQSYDADLAVQKFTNENGLITTNNQLLSDQQLGSINTELVKAEASSAEAKARLDQIRGIIKDGRTDAVVDDALGSSLINSLRQKYLEAAQLQTEISGKLGPDHIQSRKLRDQMAEYNRLIFGELGRIADSYESTYNVALKRQKSLEESMQRMTGVSAAANTTGVQLRELQREADTYRTLYENFLTRYQETVQQQSFPVIDARIITPARTPGGASSPKVLLMVALCTIMGIGSGTGLAAIREYRDRFFRTGSQVRSELQVEYLGALPQVASKAVAGKLTPSGVEEAGGGLWRPEVLNGYVRLHPHSSFAETLRNAKVAADTTLVDRKSKVIGVISCLPSEGKSTISSNLATLFAMQGAKVLLIDGDLRNPGLTRALQKRPAHGVIEAIIGTAQVKACLQWDQTGRIAVLPVALKQRISHTSDLLASAGMSDLLNALRPEFDYILVDLPPVGPVVDAKAFAGRVDAFLFVVEWGRTSRALVRNILSSNPVFRDKCLGMILNKEDQSRMKLYRSFDSSEFYAAQYSDYYRA